MKDFRSCEIRYNLRRYFYPNSYYSNSNFQSEGLVHFQSADLSRTDICQLMGALVTVNLLGVLLRIEIVKLYLYGILIKTWKNVFNNISVEVDSTFRNFLIKSPD